MRGDIHTDYYAWDAAAEAAGVVIGAFGYVADGRKILSVDRPMGPSKVPSSRCESGKRAYCTCSACF
jgi:hypothetical protein